MIISFSGLDGAGKSTLIGWTRTHLEQQGVRVAVFHMNDDIGLYAYARMLRAALLRVLGARRAATSDLAARNGETDAAGIAAITASDSIDHAPPGRWWSAAKRILDTVIWNPVLRSAVYPLDVLIFLFYRLWFERVRGQIVIMDRYFYDTLVDLSVRRARRTVRLLHGITPAPVLAVLLDISPEESFARKREYSVPYLRRRHVAYHDVMARVSSHVIIRNDDLAATQCRMATALAERGPAARAVRPRSGDSTVVAQPVCSGDSAVLATHGISAEPVARAAWTPDRTTDEALAAFTLRALLADELSRVPLPPEWPALTALAADNGVLLRLEHRLAQQDVRRPFSFRLAVAGERARADAVIAIIGTVERALRGAGIDVVFPKALMHYPDIGRDIDLLVAAHDGGEAAMVLTRVLGAVRQPVRLQHAIAGCASFEIPGCPAPLDVHCGRLGAAGEQASFAAHLLRHTAMVRVDDLPAIRTASPEDQLVLQGQERVYGRRALRLCDVVFTIRLLRTPELDWDYVLYATRRSGARAGLSCYLAYVDQIHRRIFTAELLPPRVRNALRLTGWGRVAFRRGQFIFPAARVGVQISLDKLATAVRARRWRSAGRVCLLPFVTLASRATRARADGPARPPSLLPPFRE